MTKNKNEDKCKPDAKDAKPTHKCEHGVSIPNRPGPAAEKYKRQNGHY